MGKRGGGEWLAFFGGGSMGERRVCIMGAFVVLGTDVMDIFCSIGLACKVGGWKGEVDTLLAVQTIQICKVEGVDIAISCHACSLHGESS